MQAEMRDCAGNVKVNDAGLDHHQTIVRVDFEYPAHARQLNYNSPLHCQSAAG
jgi:hypothetical protein